MRPVERALWDAHDRLMDRIAELEAMLAQSVADRAEHVQRLQAELEKLREEKRRVAL